MPSALTITQARLALRTREQLLDVGYTERGIRALVDRGELVRVRRGWYVTGSLWRSVWNEGRHLLQVVATHLGSAPPGPVFLSTSAAVLRGLPLYRLAPRHVHVALPGASHSKLRFGVAHHHVPLPDDDIGEVDGILCSSLDRTILDLACATTEETALACADAGLRELAVDGHVQDDEIAEAWRRDIDQLAQALSVRGIRKARRVIALADGRAQLPGESISRLHLHRLGFVGVELQTKVTGPDGEEYWMDFAFPRVQRFGEFDGKGKYTDPDLRGDRSVEEVVMREKYREGAVRGVTGWAVARWGMEHIVTADALGRRLNAFGIRPPG